jgi:hypothetical protein
MRQSIILLLSLLVVSLGAEKMYPRKYYTNRPIKQHPYIQLFDKPVANAGRVKAANFDRLLVILVDFQEETTDDPNTTGNGKFLLETDPNYLYSIGSPPHNQAYF